MCRQIHLFIVSNVKFIFLCLFLFISTVACASSQTSNSKMQVNIYNDKSKVDSGCIAALGQELNKQYREYRLLPIRVKISKNHNIVKNFYAEERAEVVFPNEKLTILIPLYNPKKIIIIDDVNYRLFEFPQSLNFCSFVQDEMNK